MDSQSNNIDSKTGSTTTGASAVSDSSTGSAVAWAIPTLVAARDWLLRNSGGDCMWSDRVAELMEALWPVMELRARAQGRNLDRSIFCEVVNLENFMRVPDDFPGTPEAAKVIAYLKNLPGFVARGATEDVKMHHGFLTMNIARVIDSDRR